VAAALSRTCRNISITLKILFKIAEGANRRRKLVLWPVFVSCPCKPQSSGLYGVAPGWDTWRLELARSVFGWGRLEAATCFSAFTLASPVRPNA
jgi:hypothetical protein